MEILVGKQYRFTVLGKPFGKQRPRATRNHKQFYTPQETHRYEDLVRFYATREAEMLTCPLRVDIKAYFEVPKSYSKKRRERCLVGLERPTKKPDKDNIEKAILDGMNPKYKLNRLTHHREVWAKGMFADDSQVVEGSTAKLYGEPARVEVVVTELEEEK